MKKIGILLAFGLATTLVSCDLGIDPDTNIKGEEAITYEYVVGQRMGIYTSMKAITWGTTLSRADYQTDLFNETQMSGNNGGSFARWILYANDQDVNSIWGNYYGVITRINYAMGKIKECEEDDNGMHAPQLNLYMAEMYFFRAYALHQLALRFCEDYDPAKATTQLGVPIALEYNPDAQNPRGTLDKVYGRILEDLNTADEVLKSVQGEQNDTFLSAEAVIAFRAQLALQMHDYANASRYASSLYAKYPLETTVDGLDRMWHEDNSTETIFQLEVTPVSLASVGNMSSYHLASWSPSQNKFLCAPHAVLSGAVPPLYADNDLRKGLYINQETVTYQDNTYSGYLLNKFTGNRNFQTTKTVYTYRNMPKVFRIAEMYLIDAEAKYRSGGDAAEPLNTLRAARGLAPTNATGEDLFTEIKNERIRELIGEGHRLTDLKRWGEGFKVTNQGSLRGIVRPSRFSEIPAGYYMFVWPIPEEELSKNFNFGQQNPGYGGI